MAIQELCWIMNFFKKLGVKCARPKVDCDNPSALTIAHDKGANGRTKHVDIKLQHVKEKVEKKVVDVSHISNEWMVADIFTKALKGSAFKKCKNMLFKFKEAFPKVKRVKMRESVEVSKLDNDVMYEGY